MFWLKVAGCVVLFYVVMRSGLFMIRTFAAPVPKPTPGEMRRVNLRYRCVVCGSEVRMTLAQDDDPPPPRHCLEDMELVAPLYE